MILSVMAISNLVLTRQIYHVWRDKRRACAEPWSRPFKFQGPPTRNLILQIVQEDFIGLKCLLHQLTYIFQHPCLKLIVNYCIEQERFSGYYIQSRRKLKDFSRETEFKDFSRTSPKIQGLV